MKSLIEPVLSVRNFGVLGLILALAVTLGYSQGTLSVVVSNDSCRGGVQVAEIVVFKGTTPLEVKIGAPLADIALSSKAEFKFEVKDTPTAVSVAGTLERQRQFSVTASANSTAKFECGSVVPQYTSGTGPGGGGPQLPPQVPVTKGMTPQQAITALQGAGFSLQVQGSESKPKISDVNDPLIISALGPGLLTGVVYFAASATGSLRPAVVYDQPLANVILVVLSTSGFCFSIPPAGGGLTVFCDRPSFNAPTTMVPPGGPVPGTVFFIAVLKIGGPTLPFVLSLAQ